MVEIEILISLWNPNISKNRAHTNVARADYSIHHCHAVQYLCSEPADVNPVSLKI